MPNNKRISLLSLRRWLNRGRPSRFSAASPKIARRRADKVKMYDWLPEIRYFFTNRVYIRRSERRRSQQNEFAAAGTLCVMPVCACRQRQPSKILRVGAYIRIAPLPRSKFILRRDVENSNKNEFAGSRAGLMRRKNRETESIRCPRAWFPSRSSVLKLCSLCKSTSAALFIERPKQALTSASLARIQRV